MKMANDKHKMLIQERGKAYKWKWVVTYITDSQHVTTFGRTLPAALIKLANSIREVHSKNGKWILKEQHNGN
jgi:hypothetical protein